MPPRKPRPEDLDVLTVSTADVRRLIVQADRMPDTWRLAVYVTAYLGPRRRALSGLRVHDYDREGKRLRFHEKGSKTIWKPCPVELADAIDASLAHRPDATEDDYLVPSLQETRRKGDRDDRVILRAVTDVAKAAGVKATTRALRAAFAVFYLEQNPGDSQALKELMGHRSIETTQTYLRKLDKSRAMDRVRSLSWADDPSLAETLAGRLDATAGEDRAVR